MKSLQQDLPQERSDLLSDAIEASEQELKFSEESPTRHADQALPATAELADRRESESHLHDRAEDDMRVIKQELKQYNDTTINERESIIRDKLESSRGLEQSQYGECQTSQKHFSESLDFLSSEVTQKLEDLHLDASSQR